MFLSALCVAVASPVAVEVSQSDQLRRAADDVSAFAKLPQPFGFSIDYVDFGMNLRSYYPDFVALDSSGQHWLIETKGMESAEVSQKDAAAANWCENASTLTKIPWRYVKIPQKGFEVLQPKHFADLEALAPSPLLRLDS